MALKCHCAALYASGHRELRRREETIPCTSGGCLQLLCSALPQFSQMYPGCQYRSMSSNSLGRCYLPISLPSSAPPIREEPLCNFKVWSSGLQFSDWGTAKAKQCCKRLTEQNLAKCRSQHALLKSRKIVMCWGHNNNLQP